jgi:carboxymethylenebutenolidase
MIVHASHQDLDTPTGPMRTHVYAPLAAGEARRYPGLLLYPEIYQQTGPIVRLSMHFASHGYVVMAPEIYHEHEPPGTVLAYDKACNGRLGAVGFCLGGHLAFRAALQPEVLAACCVYPTDLQGGVLAGGRCTDTLARAQEIRGELLMIWGRQDPHIPDDARASIYQALRRAERVFAWHEFNAQHAFMRDEGARHDPEAARLGLGLALSLFRRTL